MATKSNPTPDPLESLPTTSVSISAQSDGGPLQTPPNTPATLLHALRRAAAESPHGITCISRRGVESHRSYRDLLQQAESVAAGLQRSGVVPGEPIVLQFSDNPDFLLGFWGCVAAGAVPVPVTVPPSYDLRHAGVTKLVAVSKLLGRPKVLANAVNGAGLRALSAPGQNAAFEVLELEELAGSRAPLRDVDRTPDDLALLLLTSGSTGLPRAVMLSARNMLASGLGAIQTNRFGPTDVSLNWMPLDHVGGLVMFHCRDTLMGCAQLQVATEFVLQSPRVWLDLVHRHRVSITWAPNFAFGLLAREDIGANDRAWDLSCLRFVLNGGEPIAASVARRWLTLLTPLGLPGSAMHPIWGMTETASAATYSTFDAASGTLRDERYVEVGAPIPGVALRIVDSQDRHRSEGEVGALQVKGVVVTAGYVQDQGVDRSRFTEDGWFRTGDLGMLRQGCLTITGREKSEVVIRGVNYTSHEIEAVVETVPGVEPSYTAALAVRGASSQSDELVVFCSSALMDTDACRALGHRIRAALRREVGIAPDHLVLLPRDRIPKTGIGKIQRARLGQQFEAGEFEVERRRLAPRSERTSDSAGCYERIWCEIPPPEPEMLPAGPWLLFADRVGLGAALRSVLDAAGGASCVVVPGTRFESREAGTFAIDPHVPEDWDCLAVALTAAGHAPQSIVHLWGYDAEHAPESRAELDAALATSLYSIAALARLLERIRSVAVTQRLWVVSNHAFAVRPGEGAAGEKIAASAMLRTLSQEVAWLQSAHVDLEGRDLEADVVALRSELGDDRLMPQVAHRQGHRFQPRLAPADESVRVDVPVMSGGCYVVSGGLGGIGIEVTKDLLTRYGARVLVIGRSSPAAVEPKLDALRRLGDLAYVATDVADESLLAAAVSAAEHRWGRPLDGVFHLAGGYASRPLLQETAATMEKTIHTKVHGAWTLDRILADRPAATMVTFASVLGYFGGVQDGAYAASNAYLEGLAYQQRRAGRRGTCLMWGPWFETGMNRGSGFEAATRGKGYPPLQPQDGMRLLWQVLEQDRPHLLIGLEPSNVHVRSHLVSSAAAEVEPTAADFVAPRTETQQQLARIWQEVLGVPRVGLHDNFFELGGDSLQAACVFARIEAVLRRDLPIASLFRAPTVESLAALVEGASEWMPIRVVALRAIGAQVPLFCFPGGGEDAIVFRALAGLLHDDRPVYSLQCSGLDASECLEPVASIEAIASGFIRAMRVTQLRGPYFLAGHCLGGLLAFEVAQQLVAGGETVGLLGLVDTIVSDSFPTDLRAPFRDRVMHRLRCLAAWSPHKGWTDGQAQSLRGREAARARRRRRKSWEQLEAMHGAYVLRPYSGRLTLFLAADSFLNRAPERDPRLAWKQFAAGGCDVVHVAGDHESLLHAPFVADLANQIEDRMRCIESKTDATVARVYSPCAAPASNTRPRS